MIVEQVVILRMYQEKKGNKKTTYSSNLYLKNTYSTARINFLPASHTHPISSLPQLCIQTDICCQKSIASQTQPSAFLPSTPASPSTLFNSIKAFICDDNLVVLNLLPLWTCVYTVFNGIFQNPLKSLWPVHRPYVLQCHNSILYNTHIIHLHCKIRQT